MCIFKQCADGGETAKDIGKKKNIAFSFLHFF